jgi:hypothetical protein
VRRVLPPSCPESFLRYTAFHLPAFRGAIHKAIMPIVGLLTCPPKTDPQVMLEWWIEGRQRDEQEAVYPGVDHWEAKGSKGGLGPGSDGGPGLPYPGHCRTDFLLNLRQRQLNPGQ